MTSPDMAHHDWEPRFADYLYLAFTNATAFSPTDTLPLSRWAKLGMALEAAIALATAALVIAKAVNALGYDPRWSLAAQGVGVSAVQKALTPTEESMLAIAAAIVFGIWLLLDLFDTNLGAPDLFNFPTMASLGLLLLSLYLAGVGSGPRNGGGTGGGRRFYGRRPGRG